MVEIDGWLGYAVAGLCVLLLALVIYVGIWKASE